MFHKMTNRIPVYLLGALLAVGTAQANTTLPQAGTIGLINPRIVQVIKGLPSVSATPALSAAAANTTSLLAQPTSFLYSGTGMAVTAAAAIGLLGIGGWALHKKYPAQTNEWLSTFSNLWNMPWVILKLFGSKKTFEEKGREAFNSLQEDYNKGEMNEQEAGLVKLFEEFENDDANKEQSALWLGLPNLYAKAWEKLFGKDPKVIAYEKEIQSMMTNPSTSVISTDTTPTATTTNTVKKLTNKFEQQPNTGTTAFPKTVIIPTNNVNTVKNLIKKNETPVVKQQTTKKRKKITSKFNNINQALSQSTIEVPTKKVEGEKQPDLSKSLNLGSNKKKVDFKSSIFNPSNAFTNNNKGKPFSIFGGNSMSLSDLKKKKQQEQNNN